MGVCAKGLGVMESGKFPQQGGAQNQKLKKPIEWPLCEMCRSRVDVLVLVLVEKRFENTRCRVPTGSLSGRR